LKIKAYKSFTKHYKSLPKDIQAKVDKQIEILEANYLYPSLHTKKIKGKEGIWEARVDIHHRMTFEIIGDTIYLRVVGNHDDVLKNP
jgi:mRNA-degrading endonuclease RelE of RelBE toxin-antitoxin system